MRPGDPDNPLAIEIQQEMAATYFAACKKMVQSLEALKAFDRAMAGSTRDEEQIPCRAELLEEAAERVFFVIIQREAMKLSWYEGFFEDYGVPNEVKDWLGPKGGHKMKIQNPNRKAPILCWLSAIGYWLLVC